MSFDYIVCAIAGVIALVYLLAAMLRPDKF
ncbi:MAG: potassium-transporting ATPase subunit F [Hyphomonadaceae bacterium]|jgi:K+-transporting ATPase KdpF subunit|nr:potassium-transporting ATPase subunit F [Hyphomonadaceae bacterium]MCC6788833.1 potassium-transporting ATPase subunit F [Hyphomonadaceae bacterium]